MHGGSNYQNPVNGDTTSIYRTLNVDWANQMNVNTGENGVKFAFTNASDPIREGIRTPFRLNGEKIQFDNLEANDGKEPKLTILLSYDCQDSYAESQAANNLSLVLDTKKGTLIAQPSGQTVSVYHGYAVRLSYGSKNYRGLLSGGTYSGRQNIWSS